MAQYEKKPFVNTISRGGGKFKDKPLPEPLESGTHLVGLMSCKNGIKTDDHGTRDIIKFFFLSKDRKACSLKVTASLHAKAKLSTVLKNMSGGSFDPQAADPDSAFNFLSNCIDKWFVVRVSQFEWYQPNGTKIKWAFVDDGFVIPPAPGQAPSISPKAYLKALEDQAEGKDTGGALQEEIVPPMPNDDSDDIPF